MSPSRRDALILLAVLAAAAGLRLWPIGHGLPDFVEEAIPLRRALEMGGWQATPDANPRFFHYPSLVLYLQVALLRLQMALSGTAPADFWVLFQADPTRPVILARAAGVLADLVAVWGAWRLAGRLRPGAGAVAALLVAASAILIRTSRLVQVDPFLGALVVWAVERLVAWQQAGGRARLTAAVVLIGLAAGAKYQGGLLVLPLGWALWARGGGRGLARWPLLAAASFGVFLLTTPYALLDPGAFRAGLGFEARHMASGHLGTGDDLGLIPASARLLRDLGLALLLGVGGLAWAARAVRGGATAALAALVLGLAVAVARVSAERYLVPLVPLLAVGAAVLLARLVPRLGRGAGPALALLLVVVPPAVQGVRAAHAGRDHTQVQARRWIEAHLDPAAAVILREPYTASLRSPFDDAIAAAHPAWAAASASSRERFLRGPRYLGAEIPWLVSGRVAVTCAERATGRAQTLVVFAHAADANGMFYEPGLLAGVTHVLVSSAVRDRHLAEPARFPRQAAFYRHLAARGTRAASFAPGGGVDGPVVEVWTVGAAPAPPPLDPLWWTQDVPDDYRRRFDEVAAPPEARCGRAPRCPDGRLAPWVVGLRDVFRTDLLPYLGRLAASGAERGRWAAVRQVAAPMALMQPGDPRAVELFALACANLGDLAAAESALRRGLQACDPQRRGPLEHQLAQVLAALGRAGEPDAAPPRSPTP